MHKRFKIKESEKYFFNIIGLGESDSLIKK